MTAREQSQDQTFPAAAEAQTPTLSSLFLKTGLLSLAFAALMLCITALVIGVWGYFQFQKFLSVLDVPKEIFITEVRDGWQAQPKTTDKHKNILILGTDTLRTERGIVPPLTDTIMLLSLNTDTGRIDTLSLPRDVWSDAYQTKINALYAYGFERNPDSPEQFPTEVISELTGIPIHHTLVLSLEQLRTLIDLVDGVVVTVETGFTDPQFPREGVDVTTVRDPSLLYESITFEPGTQTFSGQRALQYIRSRHSEDEQGHDLARGARQQQVIQALFTKLSDYKMLLNNPVLAAQLYNFYHANFEQAFPLPELVSTAKSLVPHRKTLRFTSHQLTTIEDDPIHGVLENPPPSPATQNQWIYRIPDLSRFRNIIQSAFLLYS